MINLFKLHTLHQRIVWRTLGGITILWTLIVVWIVVDSRHELDELLDAHLSQTAAMLLVHHSTDIDDDTYMLQPQQYKYNLNVAYQVFKNGKLLSASANAGENPFSSSIKGFSTVTRPDGQDWRVFVTHGESNNIYVYVAEAQDTRNQIVWALLRGLLLPFAVALPVWVVIVWFNTSKSLQPIHDLRQHLLERSEAIFTTIQTNDLPSEIIPLVDTLNTLLIQLANRIDTERRFTADAAHELRTPIAAIRAQAQVALMVDQQDATEVRSKALQGTIQACDRASRVVEQLLTLARLEAQSEMAAYSIDVSQVLNQVSSELAPLALQRFQVLEVLNEVDDPKLLIHKVSEPALEILFRNLLDNALRYSPDSGQVRVTLRKQEPKALILDFEDSGPGMDDADIRRLGERFFRVLGNGKSGSGLGWSIILYIAKANSIDLIVDRSEQFGGLKVTLTINS